MTIHGIAEGIGDRILDVAAEAFSGKRARARLFGVGHGASLLADGGERGMRPFYRGGHVDKSRRMRDSRIESRVLHYLHGGAERERNSKSRTITKRSPPSAVVRRTILEFKFLSRIIASMQTMNGYRHGRRPLSVSQYVGADMLAGGCKRPRLCS